MTEHDIKTLGTLQDYGDTSVMLLIDKNENVLYIAIPVSDDYQYAIVRVSRSEVSQYMKGDVPIVNLFINKEINLWSWEHRNTLGKEIPFNIIEEDLDDLSTYQSKFSHSYNLINSFLAAGYGSPANHQFKTIKA